MAAAAANAPLALAAVANWAEALTGLRDDQHRLLRRQRRFAAARSERFGDRFHGIQRATTLWITLTQDPAHFK